MEHLRCFFFPSTWGQAAEREEVLKKKLQASQEMVEKAAGFFRCP